MTKTKWYARGGGIAKMGPFKSQEEATNALRLAPQSEADIRRGDPPHRRLFPDDAFVWPESDI